MYRATYKIGAVARSDGAVHMFSATHNVYYVQITTTGLSEELLLERVASAIFTRSAFPLLASRFFGTKRRSVVTVATFVGRQGACDATSNNTPPGCTARRACAASNDSLLVNTLKRE